MSIETGDETRKSLTPHRFSRPRPGLIPVLVDSFVRDEHSGRQQGSQEWARIHVLQRLTLRSRTDQTNPIVWSYCILCHKIVTVRLVSGIPSAFWCVTNRMSQSYFVTWTSQVKNTATGAVFTHSKAGRPSGSVVNPWPGTQVRKTKRQFVVTDDDRLGLGSTARWPTAASAVARPCHGRRFFGSRHPWPVPAGWSAAAGPGWHAVLPAPPRASSCRTLSAVNGLPRGV